MSSLVGLSLFTLSLLPSLLSPPLPLLAPSTPKRIKPGLVLLTDVIPLELQIELTEIVLRYGHEEGKLWINNGGGGDDDNSNSNSNNNNNSNKYELNNARQGRGRIYDALKRYPQHTKLSNLCKSLNQIAKRADADLPDITPTHLLTMYYTTKRHLGWHRDDGKQDGESTEPVVSVCLGNTCEFLCEDDDLPRGDANKIITLTLKSGDVVIFGGKSRWIKHTVSKIYTGTTSDELLDVQRSVTERYCPDVNWKVPECFRINLTFRNAPELFGKEDTPKFYYFAKSARKFAEAAEEVGVEEARRRVVEKRKEKMAEKAARKARKNEGALTTTAP
jgi:alkylated DNA repair dioxygenase AlkB